MTGAGPVDTGASPADETLPPEQVASAETEERPDVEGEEA
jgi:hypothetical protein